MSNITMQLSLVKAYSLAFLHLQKIEQIWKSREISLLFQNRATPCPVRYSISNKYFVNSAVD